jgi:hypothetical protein
LAPVRREEFLGNITASGFGGIAHRNFSHLKLVAESFPEKSAVALEMFEHSGTDVAHTG